MKEIFRLISARVSAVAGSAWAFMVAASVVFVWAVTGPAFDFSNTWQLVINTGTTIVTFLMVFLIQNTQNRDSKAMQLKLDELIRTSKTARNSFMDLEDLTDDDLAVLDAEFKRLHTDSEQPYPVIHKLHTRIEAEHKRRLSLRGASNIVGNLLNPHDK